MNQQETLNSIAEYPEQRVCTPNDPYTQLNNRYLNVSLPEIRERDKFIDAPRQLPKKTYSLAPDMATGWKPKKANRINFQNVFPINFSCQVVDQLVRNLIKKGAKYQLVYLGPRKLNSYVLHEGQHYENPYPIDKKIDLGLPERPGLPKSPKLAPSPITFNSDFESGNLDCAIKIADSQYDLFMRVDSNSRGHTNWYYFTVQNGAWVGSVKFNFCNFRRQRSLYQRGMKPFTRSVKEGNQWIQKGYNIQYERKSLRYKFLYDDEDQSFTQSQG